MSNYAICQSQTGSKASDELFIACREPTADASCHRRGSSRILLCRAAGAGVFKFRGFRPTLARTLNDDRRDAETFNTVVQGPMGAVGAGLRHFWLSRRGVADVRLR